jgi:hypothetical protein
MPINKPKAKNIVEVIKDRNMKNLNLVPNKSIGIFNIRDKINKYIYLSHTKTEHKEKYLSYDSYDFQNMNIILWVEKGIIVSAFCEKECYWKGQNLIKMPINLFLSFYNVKPNSTESAYVLVNGRGQNQMLYEFEDLGLQIWVWRKKIRTVVVSNYQNLDDYFPTISEHKDKQ